MVMVLGAQEGILQRLQSSVEQEETCWREKLEQSQAELREVGKNKHYISVPHIYTAPLTF